LGGKLNKQILPDDPLGKKFGFTKELFDGYLWIQGKYVYVSFIVSKKERKGNLKRLFEEIQKNGYGIKVPTAMGRMTEICFKNGFVLTQEWFEPAGEHCDVWVKEPRCFSERV